MTSESDIQTSSHSDVGQAVSTDAQHALGDAAGEAPEPSSLRLVRADRPDEAITELGLGEAVAVALALQRRGFLDGAQQLYERILAIAPAHPDVLHFTG